MATTAPPDVPVRSLQDILTALQRHPEWRTALRQQLLGEELLELPALFAKFAAETTRRLDLLTQDLAATNKRLDVLAQELAAFKATTTRRLDRLALPCTHIIRSGQLQHAPAVQCGSRWLRWTFVRNRAT